MASLTFKQYLITEKVHASSYREIMNDTKFFLGLEYEYYDNNLAGFGDSNDDFSDMYEHKDYKHYSEEATEIYEAFVKKIVNLQTTIDLSPYQEQFDEQRAKAGKKAVKNKEKEWIKTVEEFNKTNGTSYKPLTLAKYHDISNKRQNIITKLESESDDRTAINHQAREWTMKQLEPYGLHLNGFQNANKPEFKLVKKYQEVTSLETNVKGESYYKISKDDVPLEVQRFSDYMAHNKFLDKEGVKIPTVPSEIIDTIEYFFKKETKTDIKKHIEGAIFEALTDQEESFIKLMGYDEAFDENEYDSANEELLDSLHNGTYGDDNFEGLIANKFNHNDFPYTLDVNGSDENEWNIVEDGSLSLDEGGVEITSPKLSLQAGLESMEQVFDYIDDNGATISRGAGETGFHVNLSYKNFNLDKLDVFKMMLFMEEGLILKHFEDRLDGGWADSMTQWIQNAASGLQAKYYGLSASDYTKLKKEIITALMPVNQKSNGINRMNAFNEDGRIEFRYLGGENYHKKFGLIKTFILRFCYLLKLGMEPNYKKREYDTKLLRLIEKHSTEAPAYREKPLNKRGNLYLTDTKTGDVYYALTTNRPDVDKKMVVQYTQDNNGNEVFKAKHPMKRIHGMAKSDKERYKLFSD